MRSYANQKGNEQDIIKKEETPPPLKEEGGRQR